jgi:hypothetical protein
MERIKTQKEAAKKSDLTIYDYRKAFEIRKEKDGCSGLPTYMIVGGINVRNWPLLNKDGSRKIIAP